MHILVGGALICSRVCFNTACCIMEKFDSINTVSTVKPALKTTCIQRPPLYKPFGCVPIVLVQLILTSVKRPPPC